MWSRTIYVGKNCNRPQSNIMQASRRTISLVVLVTSRATRHVTNHVLMTDAIRCSVRCSEEERNSSQTPTFKLNSRFLGFSFARFPFAFSHFHFIIPQYNLGITLNADWDYKTEINNSRIHSHTRTTLRSIVISHVILVLQSCVQLALD